MVPSIRVRVSLLPLLVLASGTTSRCDLTTDAGTGEFHLSGTVHFLESEGGCWRLDTDDGHRYELHAGQAPDAVLRDGARVRVMVEPSREEGGVCSSAVPVDVRRVLSVHPG
jgi:hypothetical protein